VTGGATVSLFFVGSAVRWLSLSAFAATLGALAVDVFILPAAAAQLAVSRRRLRRWTSFAVLSLLVGTIGELIVRTQVMVGGSASTLLVATQVALSRTHFGRIWLVRVALIVVLATLASRSTRPARTAALAVAIGVALTTALTGHLADWGDVTPSVGLDWTHIVSASAWTGGLAALAFAAVRAPLEPPMLSVIAGRFSRLATLCLLLVVLTGLYNAWVQLPTVAALWTTNYGRVLAVKIVLVLTLAAVGSVTRWGIVARLVPQRGRSPIARLYRRARLVLLGPSRGGLARLPSRFIGYLVVETVLALAVFVCTALLGESTPARHARHGDHRHIDEAATPVRTTMDALHAAGGVPPGWLFAPPPGDARRGREVFQRLQCYACHPVAGEGFPVPTSAGPDLTGMGDHHPAGYLAESVLNPNAVIVEGPGYTGPDKRSTMPDYRDSLSVAEFVDLVAYLKSLHE
jgi:putative copper export protein/mono/diheme cytochrome c family protein